MNRKGFSIVIMVIGLVILIPILLIIMHQGSISSKNGKIEAEIKDLQISTEPQSTQCGGDGVDSVPWCSYKYVTSRKAIETALESKGYHTSDKVNYPGTSLLEYTKEDSKMTFSISESNGLATVYGEYR